MSNTAWAFATLGLRDAPLLNAIAASAIAMMSEFEGNVQNLSNTVWSFASRQVVHHPLMASISAPSLRTIHLFDPQTLSNTAWAFAKVGVQDETLLYSIASASINMITAFDGQNLANIAWSFSIMTVTHMPLIQAIASSALSRIKDLGTQSLADLAWACSQHCEVDFAAVSLLVDRLKEAVDLLSSALPATLEAPAWLGYERTVRQLQVLNLRPAATRQFLDRMGVGRAPGEFSSRAVRCIRSLAGEGARPVIPGIGRGVVDTTRVFAYAEYSIATIGGPGPAMDGCLSRESGLHGSTMAQLASLGESIAPWLRAFSLPNSSHVDRTRCAEFQVLVELCRLFAPEATMPKPQPSVVGVLLVFTTTSPCLSCLGAIRQFQLLFPEVLLEVSEPSQQGAYTGPCVLKV